MNRRDFLKGASVAGLASVVGCKAAKAACGGGRCGCGINLCLQWHA
ncbi:MAG: twin-arginine translocation signal domain-containing protein, partial [Kiritimatiellae bacterium]|nr:twin-arginine translocation signal domain-containing protein [Kiritimatiellia bacterium]